MTVDEGAVTAQTEGIAAVTVRAKNGVKADSVVIVGEVTSIAAPNYEETVQQGGFVNGKIEATSDAGESLTYTKLTDPNHGIVQVMANGEWTYYADQNFFGSDHFYIAINDESGNYHVSKVTLDVLPVALAPELGEVIQPTDKNTSVDGRMSVVKANGETLSFHIEVNPSHGQVVMNTTNGNWTYTPDQDYVGKDSFTARVENEHGKQATTNVRLYTAPTAD